MVGLSDREYARLSRERKYAEYDAMPKIPCECGCGTLIPPINRGGKPARVVRGHQWAITDKSTHPFTKSRIPWNKGKSDPKSSARQLGVPKPKEAIEKRTATRRAKNNGGYFPDNKTLTDYRNPETWHAALLASKKDVDQRGEKNPFYGKHHTQTARSRQGNRGEDHRNWKGGTSLIAGVYSIDFTWKFRALIRERDGNTCRKCGITQSDLSYTLHVHHLDHSKDNSDPGNLVTVCAKCHRILHPKPKRK